MDTLQARKEKTLQPLDPNLKYEPALQPVEAQIAAKTEPPKPQSATPTSLDIPIITVHWWKVAFIGITMPLRAFLFYMIVGGIAAGLFATAFPLLLLLLILGFGLVHRRATSTRHPVRYLLFSQKNWMTYLYPRACYCPAVPPSLHSPPSTGSVTGLISGTQLAPLNPGAWPSL
ncbi:MAG: hypothetical protein WDN27_03605 [Candidatus Saccharibacteria bacterium]